jgi:hypothetical protein
VEGIDAMTAAGRRISAKAEPSPSLGSGFGYGGHVGGDEVTTNLVTFICCQSMQIVIELYLQSLGLFEAVCVVQEPHTWISCPQNVAF